MIGMANVTSIEDAILSSEVGPVAWFSTREAAAFLGVSTRTIRRAIKAGHVAAERQGRGFRISREALERYHQERVAGQALAPRPMLSLLPFPDVVPPGPSLPAALTLFVGREGDIAALSALLQRDHVRLITLTGPGGVGKTRLALRVAELLAPSLTDGAVFVPLAAVRDERLVASAIAIALDVRGSEDKSPEERLAAHVRHRELLLLLDNFEQILEAGPLLTNLLTQCPRLTILVTSRSPLRLSGERLFLVPPLQLPASALSPRGERETPALADLARVEAVQLFLDRAEAAAPDFAMTTQNANLIAAICARTNGLPLAIELAAARTSLLSPAALLDRMDRQLPVLTSGPRDQPERLQSMRGAIAWSYDLLTSDEQAAFRALSVYVGSWSMNAADALLAECVKGSPLDVVQRLVDQAVVVRLTGTTDAPRFSMLETIREFGLEELTANGEEQRARAAHAAYFLQLGEWAGAELAGPQQLAFKAILETEMANIRAALDWFAVTDDAESALRLVGAIGWLLSTAPFLQEAQERFTAVLAMPGVEQFPDALVMALISAGDVADWLGDNAQARERYERALSVSRTRDDKPQIASTLRGLGNLALDRGELDIALDLLREGRDVAQECGSEWEVAATNNLIGLVIAIQGDVATALDLYETAARTWRALGDRGHVTSALGSAAWSAMQAREIGRAAVDYAETLENALGDDDEWYIAWCVLGAGGIQAARGYAPEGTTLLACGTQARAALGMPLRRHVQAGFDQIEEALRKRLGSDAFSAAWQAGLALPLADAADRAQAIFAETARDGGATDFPFGLTRREIDVLRLLADGHQDKEIATTLYIGYRTASSHVAAIMAKLGVDSRTAAVARAIRLGLV